MTFDKIVEALKERKFVTRRVWYGRVFIVLGNDNELWQVDKDRTLHHWRMSTQEFLADDWEITNIKFDKDFYVIFGKSDDTFYKTLSIVIGDKNGKKNLG